MSGRVMEILTTLIRRFLDDELSPPSEEDLIKNLLEKGYAPEEIDQAFALIFAPTETLSGDSTESRSMRILTPAERRKLSLRAQGLLLTLRMKKLLTGNEMESLLTEMVEMDAPEVHEMELVWILRQVIEDPSRLHLALALIDGEDALDRMH